MLLRIHDMYVSGANCTTDPAVWANQGAMYKEKMPLEERKGRAADLWKQLAVIEGLLDSDGPFAAGELSLADCALYPTYVFVVELAPISLGWEKPFDKLEKTKRCCAGGTLWKAASSSPPSNNTVDSHIHKKI